MKRMMTAILAFATAWCAPAYAANNDVDLYVMHDDTECGTFHVVAKSPGVDDREFAGAQVLLTWNDAYMSLADWSYDTGHFWFGDFVEDGAGINGTCDPDCDGIDDGDAIFLLLGDPENPPEATPAGLVIATFEFDLSANSTLTISACIGIACTEVATEQTGDLYDDSTGTCYGEGKE